MISLKWGCRFCHYTAWRRGEIDDFLGYAGAGTGMELGEQLVEVAVAPCRHRQDELERPIVDLNRFDRFEVVQRQQTAISDQHDPPDRVTRQHLLDGRHQRSGFGGIAGEHLMVDRQPVGRLHNAKHDLPGDVALLGEAELAQFVAAHLQISFGADRRQVVEDDRELMINPGINMRQNISCHYMKIAATPSKPLIY
ncbi:hypothetical protein WK57_19130 [Burkholderia ubonensis]|uniref:Uncharacterized protein n=1 Tax=Burkholderia ubonensis TaxID=101571 RepID=A0A106PPK0_9BURK|nr:hypothetical protein WL16_28310 [Burkholderia ubonensis]KWA71983.1 hypothetical protein WL29_06750 [Burkholderia ubonensis]KWB87816.1 hypothetical protein WL43_11170 [Burkholderia ubonensis]KWZ58553.1 hypothetical protein WK57_19130 [Burkholderia ubonensis]